MSHRATNKIGRATKTSGGARQALSGKTSATESAPLAMTAEEALDTDKQFVASVARALAIINAFRAEDSALGNAELADRTGLTRPTISRLTYTLSKCGYLSYNPRFRIYELGPSVHALAQVAQQSIDVRRIARPLMNALAHQANFNVGLGTRDDLRMVYTDAFEGDALIGLRLRAGSRIPILSSAMGRAYLTAIDTPERNELLAQLRDRAPETYEQEYKRFLEVLAEYNENGFCLSIGDWQKDINGAAVPIRSISRRGTYVLNLGGPAYLLPKKLLVNELAPRLIEIARIIENSLSPQVVPLSGPMLSGA
ncbi:IclR family transcriptional regulator [Pseudochelatococcus lubricantis]|uniref:IclR family transcriptional regulator n=1 Tax=Pseudochelatococcus lubricantis TaxID=1538102 RepID=UPI0035E54E9B